MLDAAGTYADCFRAARNMADCYRRRRAGNVRQVAVFRDQEAPVVSTLRMLRELERAPESVRRRGTYGDLRQVEDPKRTQCLLRFH